MAPPRLLIGSDPDPSSPDGAQSSLWPLVLVRRSMSSLWIRAEETRVWQGDGPQGPRLVQRKVLLSPEDGAKAVGPRAQQAALAAPCSELGRATCLLCPQLMEAPHTGH